jgi:hypothetical protein
MTCWSTPSNAHGGEKGTGSSNKTDEDIVDAFMTSLQDVEIADSTVSFRLVGQRARQLRHVRDAHDIMYTIYTSSQSARRLVYYDRPNTSSNRNTTFLAIYRWTRHRNYSEPCIRPDSRALIVITVGFSAEARSWSNIFLDMNRWSVFPGLVSI